MRTGTQPALFRSARLKLTLFYLAILLVFSVTATVGVRILAEREYDRSNSVQQTEVRHLYVRGWFGLDGPDESPTKPFATVQQGEAATWRRHLNTDLALINLAALMLGGLLSYWFAGRTLRPIEQAHDAQKRFAADASHELRTPLASMRLENEVFLRQKHFSETEARTQITSNLEEVQRLEQLAANLLDLTAYGQTALMLAPLDIHAVAARAARQARKQADAKKTAIEQHVAKARVTGQADSLTQLVGILLDNAIKYGPPGGQVALEGWAEGGEYVLQVRDQGPGLHPRDLPFIFDRLYRGDTARSSQTGGYGLGLALAREIVLANNASITAANNPEGGACFTVRLPLAK